MRTPNDPSSLNAAIEAELKKQASDTHLRPAEALAELRRSIAIQVRESGVKQPTILDRVVSMVDQLTRKPVTGGESARPQLTQPGMVRKYSVETDRRKAVDAYIEEVFDKTGKKITRTDIWKHARYKTRTEFERWERCDDVRPNKSAQKAFNAILKDKPHLKK